jgi:ATP-dependent Clp protease ATP-binding subunit ClpC
MEPNILDNLSSHLKNAIAKSISLATSMQHMQVTPAHMLYCLLQEEGAIAAEILKKAGLKQIHIVPSLDALPKAPAEGRRGDVATALLPELNPASKHALERAMLISYEYEHNYVGTEHLLHGIITGKQEIITKILKRAKIAKTLLQDQVSVVIENINRFPDVEEVEDMMDQMQDEMPAPQQDQKKKKKGKKQAPALEVFALNLTHKSIQADIDPVVGREEEIDRLIHVLSRRTKNNPVLVGEPGVGKTAIVEGLAKRIVQGKVPHALKRKQIYSLDLALLISGTIYRGEFESRLKQIVDEVSQRDDCILFIDELHNIIGAGSNQGTMDAANLLKPALARGKLHCIGATTHDEYKKYISNDPALERRFQQITVEEPSTEETKQILSGIATYYESFHSVAITEEAIDAAIALSNKYIHDNFLPDKAIDLVDEACARVKVLQKPSVGLQKIDTLLKQRDAVIEKKEKAIAKESFEKAMDLKEQELKFNIDIAKQQHSEAGRKSKRKKPEVQAVDIAAVLASKLGVSADTIVSDDWRHLSSLAKKLNKKIIGQKESTALVQNTLSRAYLRPSGERPLASLMFVGPSGVGKTALAKELAHALYQDKKALIKLDMSEFSEGHSVSKILGSPAGYVGHKERNKFTDQLQRRPYCVVLLDEIDKAHPDVKKLLLQMLDEGTLTDSSGKKVSFTHATIVLTSNIGSEALTAKGFGFSEESSGAEKKARKKSVIKQLKDEFSPALLARIDGVAVFNPLSKKDIEALVKVTITELSTHLNNLHKITLHAKADAITLLAKKAFSKDLGARKISQVVYSEINELLLPAISSSKTQEQFHLGTSKNSLTLE